MRPSLLPRGHMAMAPEQSLRTNLGVRSKRWTSPLVMLKNFPLAARRLKRIEATKMRYLLFFAAVLTSAPACAADTQIQLRPGLAVSWRAPRPFKNVILGDPDIVDVVQGQTNQELVIIAKHGGTTNIVLNDDNGEQVANVLINPPPEYQYKRSAGTGTLRAYRKD